MSTGIAEAHKKKEQLQGCQKQSKCGGRSRSLTERYGSQMEAGDGTLKQGANLIGSGESEAVSMSAKDGKWSWQEGEGQREAGAALRELCLLPRRPKEITKDFKPQQGQGKFCTL